MAKLNNQQNVEPQAVPVDDIANEPVPVQDVVTAIKPEDVPREVAPEENTQTAPPPPEPEATPKARGQQKKGRGRGRS